MRARALHDEVSLLKDAREEDWEAGREAGREEGRAEALRLTAVNLIRGTALDDAAA